MMDYSAQAKDHSADDRRLPATTGSLTDTIEGWLGGPTWGRTATASNTEEGRLQRLEDRLQRLEALREPKGSPEAEVSSLILRLKLELKTELDEEVESAMRSLNTIITDKMEIALDEGRGFRAHGAILGRLDDRLNEACTQLNHQTRRQEILTQSLEETLTSVANMNSHIAELELECSEHKIALGVNTQHQEKRDLVLTQSIKDVFDSVRELEQFVVKAETKHEEHQGRFNSLDAKHLEFKKLTGNLSLDFAGQHEEHQGRFNSLDAKHLELKKLTDNLSLDFAEHDKRLDHAMKTLRQSYSGNSGESDVQMQEYLRNHVSLEKQVHKLRLQYANQKATWMNWICAPIRA